MRFLCCFVLLSALMLTSPSACAGDKGVVSFGYIPFDVETFSAIRVEGFDDAPKCTFYLQKEDSRLRILASYFVYRGKNSGKFDSNVVRLRISGINGGGVIYVDRDGFFWKDRGNISGQIPEAIFPNFKREVRLLARGSSCDKNGFQIW